MTRPSVRGKQCFDCGWRGHRVKVCLWQAQRNGGAVVEVPTEIEVLEPSDRRRVLASCAAVN